MIPYKLACLLFLIMLFFISFATGHRIARLFKLSIQGRYEKIIFSTAIGLGILAYFIMGVGLVGLLYSWLCLCVFLIWLCFALWELRIYKGIFRGFGHKLINTAKQIRSKPFELVLLILLALCLSLGFLACLAPPIDLDSLVYHLAIPKIWIQNHKIVYIPYILASEYPLITEALYALGLILTNDVSSGLIIWMFSVLFALSIFSFCREKFSYTVGILSASAFCCTPLFGSISIRALVDVVTAFYAFLGLYAFLKYVGNDDYKWLIMCCAMSGLSASTKHSGVIPFVVLFFMIIATEIKRRRLYGIKNIIISGISFFIIPLPWYIKSFINTGNPTVIYFTSIFGGRNLLPDDMSTLFVSKRLLYGFDGEWTYILNSSLRFFSNSFFSGVNYWLLGIYAVIFIPLLIFIRKKDSLIIYLLIHSLGGMVLYSAVTSQTRLAVPIFAGLFISASYSAERFFHITGYYSRIIKISIIALLIIGLNPFFDEIIKRLPVSIGLESRENYIKRRVDVYSAIDYANHNLGNDSIVLTMDARGYHFDIPYIVGADKFQGFIRYDNILSISQLIIMLKKNGITHILTKGDIAKTIIPFWQELTPYMTVFYSHNDFNIYKLKL